MKTEVKKLEGSKREITIEVSDDTVKNKFEEVFKRIGEKAKVPGFRPGHIPRDILEKHFSGDAHHQVMNELIPDVYTKAVEKEGLEVLEVPHVSDVKLDRKTLSFKAQVEVMPEINLKAYKGITVKYQKAAVSADDLKRHMDSLKESRKIDTMDDSFAKAMGFPSLAELEKAIERQMLIQKENLQRQKVENQLIEHLGKGMDLKLPQSLVDKQLQDLLRQAKMDLAMKGFPKDKIAEQEKVMVEKLTPEARKQVEVYLLLAAVAKKENIALDEHMPQRVVELLFKEADWQVSGEVL
ncbi:MAG: trigger factor [Candidatus Omnitrophota bacterium]|jgi:FKBP-type peptidyl-prolyl cis-trans isomerase (trigger factor)